MMEARSRRLGLQHGNSVDQLSCVLVEGTSMSWRSAERRWPARLQRCQRLECRSTLLGDDRRTNK